MNPQIELQINQLKKDIESIKIQGATNVAKAVTEGMKLYLQNCTEGQDYKALLLLVGNSLACARENEPLARNAVKFVIGSEDKSVPGLIKACDDYLELIENSKKQMMEFGLEVLKNEEIVLTHCHSGTATGILTNISNLRKSQGKTFKVISTETRPRYQGRITAKELLKNGVDVTQIVDSAAGSFIMDKTQLPVSAVLVGCDELFPDGSFINKVGTFQMALSAKTAGDKFFAATTLLKLAFDKNIKNPAIEQRDATEVWQEAPKGLKIINPAFERVESTFVTGYITEAGILKAEQLQIEALKRYPWMEK